MLRVDEHVERGRARQWTMESDLVPLGPGVAVLVPVMDGDVHMVDHNGAPAFTLVPSDQYALTWGADGVAERLTLTWNCLNGCEVHEGPCEDAGLFPVCFEHEPPPHGGRLWLSAFTD